MLNGNQHFFSADPVMRIDQQVGNLPGLILKDENYLHDQHRRPQA
jgi:hypothetical protein